MTEPGNAPRVSIILPTYDEKGNVERLIPALEAALEEPVEFVVVDDDSPDGTAGVVAELMRTRPHLRLVVRKGERGLVGAIQRGIDEARGHIVVWMDCDFSLPPETVPRLVAEVASGKADAAIGSRYVPGGADETAGLPGPLVLFQKIATSLLNRFTRIVMGADFHDWTSGFIAIRAETVRRFPLEGDYGEYFILLMADLIGSGARWVEVPYRNVPRQVGESKTADSLAGLLRRGTRYVAHVFEARRHLARRRAERRGGAP